MYVCEASGSDIPFLLIYRAHPPLLKMANFCLFAKERAYPRFSESSLILLGRAQVGYKSCRSRSRWRSRSMDRNRGRGCTDCGEGWFGEFTGAGKWMVARRRRSGVQGCIWAGSAAAINHPTDDGSSEWRPPG